MEKHSKRCNNLLRPIVTSFLFVASLSLNAQTAHVFEINPQLSKQIIEANQLSDFKIYPIFYREVDYQGIDTSQPQIDGADKSTTTLKKSTYLIEETPLNVQELSGMFTEFPEKYALVYNDVTDKFVRNELSTSFADEYNNGASDKFEIIKNTETEALYFVMSRHFLKKLKQKGMQEEMFQLVNKLGYKEYKDGEDYYFKSKTSEIRLDERTFKAIKENPNYIANLDADQLKISALTKQSIPHSQTLDKYLSQYRIQRSKMPTASLNAWRTATANAQKFLAQINKVAEKYEGNYSFTLLKKSNTLDNFLDNLNASKEVLGM